MQKFSRVIDAYQAFFLAQNLCDKSQQLIILKSEKDLINTCKTIESLSNIKVLSFPAWDCLPYDRISPSASVIAKRAEVYNFLQKPESCVVVTSVDAILQKTPPRSVFAVSLPVITLGTQIKIPELSHFLVENGYLKVSIVRDFGEFSVRGDIVDIYPIDHEYPVRIDFFGDEVEAIRSFDVINQIADKNLEKLCLQKSKEFLIDDASTARFVAGFRERFPTQWQNHAVFQHISKQHVIQGFEHWAALFHEELVPLIEHFPKKPKILMNFDGLNVFTEKRATIEEFYQSRLKPLDHSTPYCPLGPDLTYLSNAEWQNILNNADILYSGHDIPDSKIVKVKHVPILKEDLYQGTFANSFEKLTKDNPNKSWLITADSIGGVSHLGQLLKDQDIDFEVIKHLSTAKKNKLCLLHLPLDRGFADENYLIITESDIFGERLNVSRQKKNKKYDHLFNIDSLKINDIVVHNQHGIGRYLGLKPVEALGIIHDCLEILYANDHKLLLPVENMELLSRYGDADTQVSLDTLGSSQWLKKKQRVKKRLIEVADYLIKIAANRKLEKGDIIEKTQQYDEFCHRFPYPETDDQLQAICDVIEDFTSGQPMDRLVCGDVGFGKTEVALRAAFIAAASGKQVVLVSPTTLLCRQHYLTFKERFSGLNIPVVQLSRFVKPRDAKIARQDIEEGKAKVIIATHAVLSKSVKFHDLGLVIIDEEQHFGVKQKERLKALKPHVHVLALSATPIPRTLQLSLTGVRSLSLITTPPIDRLSIRTSVMPFDSMIVREALLREHNRGGQSFFVVPRVSDIQPCLEILQALVPELSVAVAHGQLDNTSLEDIVNDVCDRKYDLLLATNIVESGIDMPWMNTIIVYRADMLGLAQLYQLRGRVGRTKVQAFAYLTTSEGKVISATAQKRLEVMQQLDHLGAGFKLASFDMDIRGAGNLVGEEQSGHLREVGVELYQNLLQEAILEARANQEGLEINLDTEWLPQINVGASLHIPESYIEDLGLRLEMYRRLSKLTTPEDFSAIRVEFINRFGSIPQECETFLQILSLKQNCKLLNISKFTAGPKGIVVSFYKNKCFFQEKLMQWILSSEAKKLCDIHIQPNHKIAFKREDLKSIHNRLLFAKKLLKNLLNLSSN